jgi:hypothetical protein
MARSGRSGTESGTLKRPFSGDNCSGRAAKRPALQQQKHLYLVLDDWERGYSIRKVDEEDLDSGAGQLPADEPPLVRIEAQHGYSWSFAAHGSKIFAMCPSASSPGIPVFDTETLGVSVCPFPQSRNSIRYYKPLYASAGDRLVAFAFPYLDVLVEAEKPWSWTSVEPFAPFASCLVSGYALHPDGRTIFMSVECWRPNPNNSLSIGGGRNSTFTFDTESLAWTYLGEWLLPFRGRAHYDGELDAWVGLCFYREGAGHLCCCDVPPAAGCQTMPAWKFCKDLLFDVESGTHVGATLLYMGDARFCLVECTSPKTEDDHDDSNRRRRQRLRVLNLTSFAIGYSKEGDLRIIKHRACGSMSYQIAHECFDVLRNPVAFWM